MSLQFLSHRWDVECIANGLIVRLSQEDLHSTAISILVDELYELALEHGRANLYVDFANVRRLASIVFGKLISLDRKLRDVDCRLVLCNVDPAVYQAFRAARLTENLDVRLPGDNGFDSHSALETAMSSDL
jgi:anti-anti-sigma regulatory factor